MSALCPDCAGITIDDLRLGYPHLPNARDLVASSKVCPLCNLLRQALDQARKEVCTDDDMNRYLLHGAIVLRGIGSWMTDSKQKGVIGISANIPTLERLRVMVSFNLYSLPGSAACINGDVAGRPLLADASSDQASQLVKGWFKNCVDNHQSCNTAFSSQMNHGELPQLPTRLVDVGSLTGSAIPHLVEAVKLNGAQAHYATLSHCWGIKKFLTTTKKNLAEHRTRIPAEKLTKTFQEAIAITRGLGLTYLWIDNLCIVQDDDDDWRRESKKMGRIYRDSQITIAASSARDGSEGCFLQRPARPTPPPVELPYVQDHELVPNESIYAALYLDEDEGRLDQTPLAERA